MNKADVDAGLKAVVPTEIAERMKALERENQELRQANEILNKASTILNADCHRAGRSVRQRLVESGCCAEPAHVAPAGTAPVELDGRARAGGERRLMARGTTFYSLAHAARMIGESRELHEVVAANPDDVDDGEMIHVTDGTEEGVTAFTARGIESLQEFLQDVRSWPGGIRQFLIDQECNLDLIERIMAGDRKR